jgi:hypothetical protein
MTKTDAAIYNRADEIWLEKVTEQGDYSFLKALSQAAREWRERQQKRGRVEVRQIGWLEYT